MLTRVVPSVERITHVDGEAGPVTLIQNKGTVILRDTNGDGNQDEIAQLTIQNTQAAGGANVFINIFPWNYGSGPQPAPGAEYDQADNVGQFVYVLAPTLSLNVPCRDMVVGFCASAAAVIAVMKVVRKDETRAPNVYNLGQ